MSIYLSRKKIGTSLYLGSAILSRDDFMYVDEVHLLHKWQRYEIEKFIFADKYFDGKSQHYFLVPKYKENNYNRKTNIAIYSSGMYCRDKFNFNHPDALKTYQNNELLLNKLIKVYSKNHPEISFIIFLHFGIETMESASNFYKDILENDNVHLFRKFQSQKYFNDYEIGLSNISATLFERLDGGHKSCFVFPSKDFTIFNNTELKKITINDFDDAMEKIEYLRNLPREKYFKKIRYTEVI